MGIQKKIDQYNSIFNLTKGSHTSKSDELPQGEPMDINALSQGQAVRQRQDFQRFISGRCWGCGSVDHIKTSDKCPAKNSFCGYCKRPGHRETVCKDKFLGLERDLGLKPKNSSGQGGSRSTADKSRSVKGAEVGGGDQDEAEEKAANELDTLVAAAKELEAKIAAMKKSKGF